MEWLLNLVNLLHHGSWLEKPIRIYTELKLCPTQRGKLQWLIYSSSKSFWFWCLPLELKAFSLCKIRTNFVFLFSETTAVLHLHQKAVWKLCRGTGLREVCDLAWNNLWFCSLRILHLFGFPDFSPQYLYKS